MSETKRCPLCGETKSLDNFGVHARYVKQPHCRPCHKARMAEWDLGFLGLLETIGMSRSRFRSLSKPERKAIRAQYNEASASPSTAARRCGTEITDPNLIRLRALILAERASVDRKNTEIREGFVYVMSNPVWPNRCKIGMALDPDDRLSSFQTGDPDRAYRMELFFYVTDRAAAEDTVHEFFDHCRIGKTEWFTVHHNDAIATLNQSRLRDILSGGTIH